MACQPRRGTGGNIGWGRGLWRIIVSLARQEGGRRAAAFQNACTHRREALCLTGRAAGLTAITVLSWLGIRFGRQARGAARRPTHGTESSGEGFGHEAGRLGVWGRP